jgi:hypothetical protein
MMATRRKRRPWLASDIRQLRTMARKTSARTIGRRLKRTEGAVRQMAGWESRWIPGGAGAESERRNLGFDPRC